mmetsp:Transcript_5008/g.5705  ORF Transcript_5008/g.5705 Transcript_5008/m.5705 type:complete len:266 (-) Transcript_5008:27-824(-)
MKGLKNLDEYQQLVLTIRNKINKVKEDMEKRKDNIKINGYQSKDRILADSRINTSIKETEDDINTVEILVRKKAAKYSPEDLKNRNKTITLLKKNLSLIRNELMGDKENVSLDSDAPKKIFGDYKDTDSDQISPDNVKVDFEGKEENKYEDRELNDNEKQALEQFKKNDQELDLVLDKVIAGLSQLEDKGAKLNENINKQNEIINKTSKKIEKTNIRLRQQNNNLKDVLQKIRSTNKLCCDLCLVIFILGLFTSMFAILNSKGYF